MAWPPLSSRWTVGSGAQPGLDPLRLLLDRCGRVTNLQPEELAAFRSKGHGTEAVKLLCRFGFADLNLHRIYLHVFETNSRAIRAYEKSGFVREGSLREAAFIDGKWLDVAVMGLIKNNE